MNGEAYRVTFENEFVRIVMVTLAAHQQLPAYRPAATKMVRIDLDSKKASYSDGPLPEESGRAIDKSIREIRVELKAAPPTPPLELDAVRLDPNRYRVEFENPHVRVVRLKFAPREGGLMVAHPPRVLVTLTEVAVKLKFLDGRTDQRGAPSGVAAWLETEILQTENARDETLEVVLVEPKSAHGF